MLTLHVKDMTTTPRDHPPLQFQTLDKFVEKLIALIYERGLDGQTATWCPEWWHHAGAVYRLTALWQAWEHMHVHEGPVGAAKWLVYYAEPTMTVVLAGDGDFKGCSPEHGHKERRPHDGGVLPTIAPPAGLCDPRQ